MSPSAQGMNIVGMANSAGGAGLILTKAGGLLEGPAWDVSSASVTATRLMRPARGTEERACKDSVTNMYDTLLVGIATEP